MTVTFVDDDAGFVRWRDTYQSGFVLSHERKPRPNFLKLHRASCPTLRGDRPARGGDWTRVLPKTCSHALDDLERWAQMTTGGELDPGCTCVNGSADPPPGSSVSDPSFERPVADVNDADIRRLRGVLRNELGWMLRAAVLFERGAGEPMALQDSTLLHARKLIEFAANMSLRNEDAGDGRERRVPSGDLARFLDDWVLHLGAARGDDLVWPMDETGTRITNDDPQRLSKTVDLVLQFLEITAADVRMSPFGDTYLELLSRAQDYWHDP
jgi:hypothetical protein